MSDELVKRLRNPAFPPDSRLQDDARELMRRCFEAADRIQQLEAENARLRGALKPFADKAGEQEADWPNTDLDDGVTAYPMSLGDLRRARTALKGTAHD